MSPPLVHWGDAGLVTYVTADILPQRRDELLFALRRRDDAEIRHQLARWSEIDIIVDDEALEMDDFVYREPMWDDLTRWLHGEIGIHVAEGRHEYAICLLERYAFPPAILTKLQSLERDKENP